MTSPKISYRIDGFFDFLKITSTLLMLVIVLLLPALVPVLHNHDTKEADCSDCPACILQYVVSCAETTQTVCFVQYFTYFDFVSADFESPQLRFISEFFLPRAPPSILS